MAKEMLNVSDGSTSTQQASGKRLSQIAGDDRLVVSRIFRFLRWW
jgi:hypothetical protein